MPDQTTTADAHTQRVEQCRAAGTAPFVKQLGAAWARQHGADPKGGNWDHWPADLRVRDYPTEGAS